MIIIADSGSTKTDWVLATPKGQVVQRVHTEGINPFHQSEDTIRAILQTTDIVGDQTVSAIHFYGSGLRPEFRPLLSQLLSERFHVAQDAIEAEGDLLGAARALCGQGEGIACILGTGANSCLYDGHQIVLNTPPLGYILGDEGSGAVLGRNLLNSIYKGIFPKELRELFEKEMSTTMAEVIHRVYREPMGNRYLASLSVFIYRHLPDYPQLSDMVVASFRQFLRNNVNPYHRNDLALNAVGSIAYYYQTELAHAAALEGYQLEKTEQTPMKGLLSYHSIQGV